MCTGTWDRWAFSYSVRLEDNNTISLCAGILLNSSCGVQLGGAQAPV